MGKIWRWKSNFDRWITSWLIESESILTVLQKNLEARNNKPAVKEITSNQEVVVDTVSAYAKTRMYNANGSTLVW